VVGWHPAYTEEEVEWIRFFFRFRSRADFSLGAKLTLVKAAV